MSRSGYRAGTRARRGDGGSVREGRWRRAGLIAGFLLASCGAGVQWVKEGATPADVERDVAECELRAGDAGLLGETRAKDEVVTVTGQGELIRSPAPGALALAFQYQHEVFVRCMDGKHYTMKPSEPGAQ